MVSLLMLVLSTSAQVESETELDSAILSSDAQPFLVDAALIAGVRPVAAVATAQDELFVVLPVANGATIVARDAREVVTVDDDGLALTRIDADGGLLDLTTLDDDVLLAASGAAAAAAELSPEVWIATQSAD